MSTELHPQQRGFLNHIVNRFTELAIRISSSKLLFHDESVYGRWKEPGVLNTQYS
jgi:hypothetical protein